MLKEKPLPGGTRLSVAMISSDFDLCLCCLTCWIRVINKKAAPEIRGGLAVYRVREATPSQARRRLRSRPRAPTPSSVNMPGSGTTVPPAAAILSSTA